MLNRILLTILTLASLSAAASWNGYSMKRFTSETPHFRIHYHAGLEHLVKPVGDKFEELYSIYKETYNFKLPAKTEVLLQDSDESNGLAVTNLNFIILWTHDFDFNLRGSHDWFDDVITHEYAHLASIANSLHFPTWMEGIQFGYFTHPNEARRAELFHAMPPDIMPPWFAEGIAQYESSRHGADSWDTHRDMILRTLSLSNRLLSWDHMQTFAGKGDDFEKTYNHGFSMVRYIAQTYGYEKIVEMIDCSSGLIRFNFDRVIKDVLGIPAGQLYDDWKAWLAKRYEKQVDSIGSPLSGRKISKHGYENYWPRFSPDGNKIYFISNGKHDYGFKNLYSYALADTIKEDDRIKGEMPISTFYDIHAPSGYISFSSAKSRKSQLPPERGGAQSLDLFIDTLPPEKKPLRLFPKKTERQLTFGQGIFSAAFSPTGDRLVAVKRDVDRFYLAITDTAGKEFDIVYPDTGSTSEAIHFIYSLDWSPDGKTIAFSYFDKEHRKIALYDTASRSVLQMTNEGWDDRDPSFCPDGSDLYFASDRTGIFNIYRYSFDTGRLGRMTNVTGGAFAPSVSPDGRSVAYAGYDSCGYGIYLLDTLKVVHDTVDVVLMKPRQPLPVAHVTEEPLRKPYVKIPRQFLLRPTIIAEQLNTKTNNVYSGSSAFKAGAVALLMDPYSWLGMGTQLGGLFLLEPTKILKFINFDNGLVNLGSSFDAALFGTTQILPVTLSVDYYLRGIAGRDWFFNETEGEAEELPYNIRLQDLTLQMTHFLAGEQDNTGRARQGLTIDLLGGIDRYDVYMGLPDYGTFNYNVSQSYRAGAMSTLSSIAVDSRMSISPRGIAAKLQYSLRQLYSINEENSFNFDNGLLEENLDRFLVHEGIARVMAGTELPYIGDLHFDIKGEAIRVAQQDTVYPSFYLPIAWVPGYTYYSRDSVLKPSNENPDRMVPNDTVLVTGTAVVSGSVSYRFPLSPSLIDKRLGILYLEKIYGCLNLSGGVGVAHPSRLLEFKREDWLVSYGGELRVQGSTFGYMPIAVSLRWDRGIDRPEPKGGDRFTLNIGFDFDNWGLVSMPDYLRPARGY